MKKIYLLFAIILLTFPLSSRAGSDALEGLSSAVIYLDHFMGSGKTTLSGAVITMKRDVLKFRIGANEYDYSGNYSIFLKTPRQHQNPYFGFGTPETAKLLTLQDFFKGNADGTVILQNVTIWEKSEGFIDVVVGNKEWIHSGNYTISN